MISLNILSSVFKIHTTRKGEYEPAVLLTTETGTEIQFTDFTGGKSIFVKRASDAKPRELVHWGVDPGVGKRGYGKPEYKDLNFFAPFAQQGEDLTVIAANFTEQVFEAVANAFNSDDGRLFLASLVEMRATVPAQPSAPTAFSRVLGTMSQFRACAKGVTTADEFLAKIAESDAKSTARSAGVNLPVASLTF